MVVLHTTSILLQGEGIRWGGARSCSNGGFPARITGKRKFRGKVA